MGQRGAGRWLAKNTTCPACRFEICPSDKVRTPRLHCCFCFCPSCMMKLHHILLYLTDRGPQPVEPALLARARPGPDRESRLARRGIERGAAGSGAQRHDHAHDDNRVGPCHPVDPRGDHDGRGDCRPRACLCGARPRAAAPATARGSDACAILSRFQWFRDQDWARTVLAVRCRGSECRAAWALAVEGTPAGGGGGVNSGCPRAALSRAAAPLEPVPLGASASFRPLSGRVPAGFPRSGKRDVPGAARRRRCVP